MLETLIILLILIASYDPYSGSASYYNQSPTDKTIQFRMERGSITQEQVQETDVFLAVMDCERIGEEGVMRLNNYEEVYELTYLVYDCAGSHDTRIWMLEEGIVGELDFYTTETYVKCRCGAWLEIYPK